MCAYSMLYEPTEIFSSVFISEKASVLVNRQNENGQFLQQLSSAP